MTSMVKADSDATGTSYKSEKSIISALAFIAVLIALVAVFQHIRIIIASPAFWLDELITVVEARMSIFNILREMLAHDVHPPLYVIAVHFWSKLFDQNESAYRLISFLFYAISVFILVQFRNHMNQRAFLLFCILFLLAHGPLHNAHELRSYSLMFLLSTMFLYGDLSDSRPLRLLSIFLLAQSHLFGIIIAGLALLTVIASDWRRGKLVQFDTLIVGFSIIFWPIVFVTFGNIVESSQDANWITSPWIQSFYDFFSVTFTPLISLSNWVSRTLQIDTLLITAALFIVFIAASVRMATELEGHKQRVVFNSLFILSGLIFGTALLGIVKPISIPRYLIGGVPFACFLAALLLHHWMAKGKAIAIAVLLSVVGFAAISAAQTHHRLTTGRLAPIENWPLVASTAIRAISTPEQLHFYVYFRSSSSTANGPGMTSMYTQAVHYYLPPGMKARALERAGLATAPAGTVIMMQHVVPVRFEEGQCHNEVTDHLAALGRPFEAMFTPQGFRCQNGVVVILDK